MKLENCGRCGLEPVAALRPTGTTRGAAICTSDGLRCPSHLGVGMLAEGWNAAQFAARTERINAAAEKLWAVDMSDNEHCISYAVRFCDDLDAAARVRWAEMKKGE